MSQINSAPPRREESPERLARPLIQLAKACGVATCYIDQLGTYVEIRDAVLISVLGALGVDASTPELVDINLNGRRNEAHERLVAPTVVKFLGTPASTPLHTKHGEPHIGLTLEDGSDATDALSLTFREHDGDVDVYDLAIGDNLEIGYHTLHVRDGETGSERDVDVTLLCAPASIPVPEALASHKRWGWMTQMYSVRSPESWGVGDYGDLRELLVDAAGSGADFMLINPVHASAPVSPIEPSPYSPMSRRFINTTDLRELLVDAAGSGADFMLINPVHASAPVSPIEPSPYSPMSRRFINTTYIRPQNIAEFAELNEQDAAAVRELHEQVAPMNTESSPMDLDAAWKAKRAALQIIFRQPRSAGCRRRTRIARTGRADEHRIVSYGSRRRVEGEAGRAADHLQAAALRGAPGRVRGVQEEGRRRSRHLGTVERRLRSARRAVGTGFLVPHGSQEQRAHPGAENRARRPV